MVNQKADKGNTIVILNKTDYIWRLNRILDDTSKLARLHVDKSKVLNHIIHIEQCIIDLVKCLKNQNEISEKYYITYVHQVQNKEYLMDLVSP